MIEDKYKRKIDYLRISVTDRCNLRCVYCMPEEGIVAKPSGEILTFEEIIRFAKIAVGMGINKIRLTGGEPLVRKGITKLIASISKIPNIQELSLTTNGMFLAQYAKELKESGIKRINISLDTLKEDKFKAITRNGRLRDVLEGISEAKKRGFFIKLNVVALRGINTDEIDDFVRFGREHNIIVRFIEFMPTGENYFWKSERFISINEIIENLRSLYSFSPAEDIEGNGPACYYRFSENGSVVGFISALSCKFCHKCNRLRFTSDGFLLSCLAFDFGVSIKDALRNNYDADKIISLIKEAVYLKPKEHIMLEGNLSGCGMSEVGG